MTQLERYHDLRSRGLCGQCGKLPAKNYTKCGFCRDTANRLKRERGEKTKYNPARYMRFRAQGLCVTCGAESKRFSRCNYCRSRVAEYGRKRRSSWKLKYDRVYREHAEPAGVQA